MIPLGIPRVSGAFPLSTNADSPTVLVTTPAGAMSPAEITVRNPHATAIFYLRWVRAISGHTGGKVTSNDYAIILNPGEAYTWSAPPRGSQLLAISDTASSKCPVSANWTEEND